jgi:D-3-phosphoglycerate dehydrogenase
MDDRRPYNIVVTGPSLSREARELLEARRCAVVYVHGQGSAGLGGLADSMREHLADGLIVRQGSIDRRVLAASGRLRAVSKHGVGVDNIDIAAAAELGIVVMNTPAANFEAVAEHALALVLALARSLPRQDAFVRAGKWSKGEYTGHELAGKALGLVGFGRVGRRLAELVAPLRMGILAYDPWAERSAASPEITFVDELDDLLEQADVVSLHCPLTQETRGMIAGDQLRRMRKDAWLVNTARGAIVEEAALIRALSEKLIAGAALDTFEVEPPNPDNPLFSMDNVIVTNHIGGVSAESMRNMAVGAVENVLCVLDGRQPDSSVVVTPT